MEGGAIMDPPSTTAWRVKDGDLNSRGDHLCLEEPGVLGCLAGPQCREYTDTRLGPRFPPPIHMGCRSTPIESSPVCSLTRSLNRT